MSRVNRIDRLRPAQPIARMPEQEIAFLKEEMRQRAELEDENQRQKEPPPEPPSPEEQAQRRAERVIDGAMREAAIRPHDPSTTPVVSISDLFRTAKSAGLREDETSYIQMRLKQLRPQERTQELRFLQNKVLPSRNWAQALRTYSEISVLYARYPERLTTQIIQSLISGIIERPSGKLKIPAVVLHHQEALEAALLIPQLGKVEFNQLCNLLSEAALRSGKKIRDADADTERAFILKATALRSHLFMNPDPLNKLRIIAGIPVEGMREVEIFASRIRGVPVRDLIDFANKPLTLAVEESVSYENQPNIHSKDYLSDGFFDANGSLKSELIGLCSQSMASRFSEEGLQLKELSAIVDQLLHVVTKFQKRFGDEPEEKLDAPTVSAIKLILESENIALYPSFWELSDSSRKWLIDLRALAALTLHLDSIRSWM